MTAPTPDEAAALRHQWNADCADLRMDAYYYGFDGTGSRPVDLVLSAVATAGKGSHHTEDWGEYGHVEQIQEAADAAARVVRGLEAERDSLRAEVERLRGIEQRARDIFNGPNVQDARTARYILGDDDA
ncbi:hypothetical protein [Pseudonocardia sp. D17]|uniref:hypothetical protein n=1 Tax=Pseudonocardia sp. D17 TaxID=882661 RepID=UPI002B36AAC0|nr:hypothetical protein PSD17_55250 [Pseudonocardia sp. D17]